MPAFDLTRNHRLMLLQTESSRWHAAETDAQRPRLNNKTRMVCRYECRLVDMSCGRAGWPSDYQKGLM
jgi:hypothetical protein